jgi:PAS domain S-box-containing protein
MSIVAIGIATLLTWRILSASAALRRQAELLDLSHDMVFVRGLDGVVSYWNRTAEQLCGWTREEAVGKVAHQLLQTVFPMPPQAIADQVLREGRWEGELAHRRRDGSPLVVASRWSLQRDERNRPVAVLETGTDLTERRRVDDTLQQTRSELAHVARVISLGELTASVAHEVNQPLAAIVTNGEACLRWLDRKVPALDEARQAVSRAINEARRASAVIQRIRTLSRKSEPRRMLLDLNDVIEDTIPLAQRELTNHRIRLRLELASDLPPVIGDRIQLQQVLINLLVNGIQSMAATTEGPRELLVETRRSGGEVLIRVQDSGIGIPPEKMGRLFEPFFTTKKDGLGMGLSICRAIVEAHGGRVWASENAGPGATLQFALPVSLVAVR